MNLGRKRGAGPLAAAFWLASLASLAQAQPPGGIADDAPLPTEAAGPGDATAPDEGAGAATAEEPTAGGAAGAPLTAEPSEELPSSDDGYPDEALTDDWDEETGAETRALDHYVLERVEVRGNTRTRARVIRSYVPLSRGDVLDPEAPEVEIIKWRLLGTGWFRSVDLRLERGSRRGWVVLVVEVRERNTIVVQQVALGVSEGLRNAGDLEVDLLPYAGLQIAETNLAGLGMQLSLSAVGSRFQQGAHIAFEDPRFAGTGASLRLAGFYNNAREFFGNGPLVSIACPTPPEDCDADIEAKNAVVIYHRGGFRVGTGHDLGASTRYTIDWQFESVRVTDMPDAASETRGTAVYPIDFSIEQGRSYVSVVRAALVYDRRDDPALPTRGVLARVQGDAGTRLLGSQYDFLRAQGLVRGWVPMPWSSGHSLRFGAFLGVVFGDAPFFYKFHASDLTDLIPSRVLEMELDRRPPPNLLDTAVGVMRNEEIGVRVDVEYGLPLYRGNGGVRAVNAYFGVGVYALADFLDLEVAVPGYDGISRVPFDLTFDVGLRADTDIGVFQFGFSNILGFIEL